MDKLPDVLFTVPYIIFNGKRWFCSSDHTNLQCACCLYIQPLKVIREGNATRSALVIGFTLEDQGEAHAEDCPQRGNA